MSSEENVYQTPNANLEVPQANDTELASRVRRFFAALIDGFIGMAYSLPILFFFGFWDQLQQGIEPSFGFTLVMAAGGMIFFMLVHGYLLTTRGQTVGKMLLGIKIVDLSGNLLSFGKVVGLRYLPIWIVTLIPVVGSFLPMIDALFIFRKDRRCIHDFIAGTRVINIAA